MPSGLFRVLLPDGSIRLACGPADKGPVELLAADLTIRGLLRSGPNALLDAVEAGEPGAAIPDGARLQAPVDAQEIWAAGVTYQRSREARVEESLEPSVYDRVYDAERPELFFKSLAWRARGPGEPIGIRADSDWDVPEPELALFLTDRLDIAGYSIANDVSSRSIEGDNPLYLPQAKTYDGACAIGPCVVPTASVELPFDIALEVVRGETVVLTDTTTTSRLHRSLEVLVQHLGRALSFPDGVVLMTGTGIVPDASFTLRDGDLVRIAVDGLGTLENPTVTVEVEHGQPSMVLS